MRIEPESGHSRPLASFSRTDFPVPAGPRIICVWPRSTEKLMFFSTTFSSNAIDTSSNATTGPGWLVIASPDWSVTVAVGIGSL